MRRHVKNERKENNKKIKKSREMTKVNKKEMKKGKEKDKNEDEVNEEETEIETEMVAGQEGAKKKKQKDGRHISWKISCCGGKSINGSNDCKFTKKGKWRCRCPNVMRGNAPLFMKLGTILLASEDKVHTMKKGTHGIGKAWQEIVEELRKEPEMAGKKVPRSDDVKSQFDWYMAKFVTAKGLDENNLHISRKNLSPLERVYLELYKDICGKGSDTGEGASPSKLLRRENNDDPSNASHSGVSQSSSSKRPRDTEGKRKFKERRLEVEKRKLSIREREAENKAKEAEIQREMLQMQMQMQKQMQEQMQQTQQVQQQLIQMIMNMQQPTAE